MGPEGTPYEGGRYEVVRLRPHETKTCADRAT